MREISTLLWLLSALGVGWLVVTCLTAVAAERVGAWLARRPEWTADRWPAPEVWLALAASGAAVGGFVAYALVASLGVGTPGWPGSITPLAAIGVLGMVGGAALSCSCAAAYLWSTP